MEAPPLPLPIPSQPPSLRRSLNLLQTYQTDLQDLIHLRSSSIQILSTDPTHAQRIDTVISDAQQSLSDISRLIPGTGLRDRLAWMMVDSRAFVSHEGVIAAQHRRVVGELAGLRGVVVLGRLAGTGGDGEEDGDGEGEGPRMDWDNVGLLEEMLRGKGRAVGYRLPPLPDLPPAYDFKDFKEEGGEVVTGAAEMAGVSRLAFVDGCSSGLIRVETSMAMSDASSGLIKVDTPTGDESSGLIKVDTPTGDESSGLIKVDSPTKTAPEIDGMDLLFGNKVEPTKTAADVDGFDLLFGNLNLDISTGLVTIPPSQTYRSRPSFQHRPVSELDASPFTPPPLSRNGTPIPELQSQTHVRHTSLPLSFPSQQSGPTSPPPKPLSTIPQELIHRYDGYQSPQSPPHSPPQTLLRPVLPSTTSQPIYPYRDRASTSPAPWQSGTHQERSYSGYSPYREHQPSSPPPKLNGRSSIASLATQKSQSSVAGAAVYELPGGQVFYPNMRSGTPSTGWKLFGQADGG